MSGIADELADIKRLAVNLQFHCGALSCHGHFVQLLGIFSHIQQLELHFTFGWSNLKLTCHVLIAHKSKRQRVLAVLESGHVEVAASISNATANELVATLFSHFDIDKTERFRLLSVQYLAFHDALRPSGVCTQTEQEEYYKTFHICV